MPPVLGYVALEGGMGPWAWALFAILFAWQFPHFMAIAWLYRADYARAGLRMLPAIDGAEGIAGRQAILYGAALVPVSLLPLSSDLAGPVYAAGALVLGLGYLAASIAFALRECRPRARRLLLVSVFYLPALLAVVLIDPVVRTALRN
jgi:protoheme IX farnesyltransferase